MPRVGLDQSKIIHAAIELANDQGLEQVTIAALAKKLGVRPPSLYNHFSSLIEIRTKIAREGMQKLEDTLIRSVAGKSGEEAILSFSKQYLTFANANPGLYEATIQPMNVPDNVVADTSKNMIDLLVQLLSAFSLTEQESLHLVRGLRSIVHGFASLQRAGGFQMNFKVEDSLLYTIKLLCDGMKAKQ
ncbi:TetR/AcrR family transcriptional regulator [Shimazuella sp. AN120528]|uniref:TetR/AcrR family transcriptional regulator n=1 Tax=Shimazuella soli TaxID=1892854 RepID=UPI001F0F6BC1|nr:TetR/AcrR family transcriptional regulator [Shimazuella soli]MCH5585357.1 TetR/AcrR family transcriptional regulator [Shimazuella soli]